MPRKSMKDKQRRADLLARVPPSATRVQVLTGKGERKYRSLDPLDKNAISDTDTIQTNKSGDPIVMKGKPGRKAFVDVGPANATIAELLKRKHGFLSLWRLCMKLLRHNAGLLLHMVLSDKPRGAMLHCNHFLLQGVLKHW